MTDDIPVGTPIDGAYGKVEPVPLEGRTDAAATVCFYLITAKAYHPLWDQYCLAVVSLAPIEGMPPAHVQFLDATHELIVYALDPTNGPYTVEWINKGKPIPHLLPINIVQQYIATDDEMRQVAWLACNAVVDGVLNPETSDAPTRIRESWLAAVTKTLAHIRGEEHDRSV